MGNQQETNRQLDLAWLGGIWDGEGTFCLAKRWRKNRTVLNYNVHIAVSNQCLIMLNEISRVLDENNIPYHVQTQDAGKATRFKGSGKVYLTKRATGNIKIIGYKRARHFLPIIIPYIRGKKVQAELLLEYVNYRLSMPSHGAIASRAESTYDTIDSTVYNLMAKLKRMDSPETIRQTHKECEDIVRTLRERQGG